MINRREVPSDAAGWVYAKQSRGIYFFIREEALRELKMTEMAFRKSVSRLADKGRVVRIRSGSYSIVPLGYGASGTVPPIFGAEFLARRLASGGGTALDKIYFKPPRRYE
jgi:hypothetical protein